MPQISPMNWVLIIIIFVLISLIIKMTFKQRSDLSPSKIYLKSIGKGLKW